MSVTMAVYGSVKSGITVRKTVGAGLQGGLEAEVIKAT